MRNYYVAGLLFLIVGLIACQSELAIKDVTGRVTSSVHIKKEGVGTSTTAEPDHSGARDATMALQLEVLTYVNQARSQTCLCGSTVYPAVTLLTLNSRLNGASDKYAVDMATYNYFSHTGRDGSQPWDRMTTEGYVWSSAGENIAAGYPTARSVVDAWLSSTIHCQNIMNPDYRNLGVGYSYNSKSTFKHYWVTDFGTRQ
ncbi:CAP domain-containing protein [Spirosoma panaciterrae]|uniref:CAP domain-containing protein n=1 Tax=Spirosoma panaciterrae TaxID=496058 RepID=UPI0003633AC9|nr:CAP domain-containing protein [Spirosoma panaciterrae]